MAAEFTKWLSTICVERRTSGLARRTKFASVRGGIFERKEAESDLSGSRGKETSAALILNTSGAEPAMEWHSLNY
ncbi:hypothetical protein MPTK1_Vg00200 [Marchantia polymorpha subsp. ruderalis]|uniref:Uncharacterized protein n=1 Tax=Marchantia polymorpha TaxID=3197 RepID=A0A2R6VWY3_MARPO|nr:hypothetical protein MARPO_YB0030 [Marchantia polymorpha]BBN20468.1 hypothetical protein Mp_Vg00200 [Marchantia polymorpha subsp. ruderalis]|eukprot:PTQ26086.1 hypothetical protein MARPO_YB0030 [Marchantia polymorpha]